jgi:hypothetical protein
MDHPDVRELRPRVLGTRDTHDLYRLFGFERVGLGPSAGLNVGGDGGTAPRRCRSSGIDPNHPSGINPVASNQSTDGGREADALTEVLGVERSGEDLGDRHLTGPDR